MMRNKRKSCKVEAPLEKQKINKKLHGYLNKKAESCKENVFAVNTSKLDPLPKHAE